MDGVDRRQTRLRLGVKGTRVRNRAIFTSSIIERELQKAVGPKDVLALRRTLVALLEQNGALEEAVAARARPVW